MVLTHVRSSRFQNPGIYFSFRDSAKGILACEQALQGAPVAGLCGWAGKLATTCTSLEFEYLQIYLHRKSRCEMLIGGNDISYDVVTLGTCFSMFVYIRADWRKSDSSVDGEPPGNWRWNSNSRDTVAYSPSFSPVNLHRSKPLISLVPFNLHFHCFQG